MENESKTPTQRALEDLQRFRRRSNVEIDYRAELAKAKEEKYCMMRTSHFSREN